MVVDRMPYQVLDTKSVRELLEYIHAYGIAWDIPFVEKSDLIKTILETDLTECNEEVIFRFYTLLILDIPSGNPWIS